MVVKNVDMAVLKKWDPEIMNKFSDFSGKNV